MSSNRSDTSDVSSAISDAPTEQPQETNRWIDIGRREHTWLEIGADGNERVGGGTDHGIDGRRQLDDRPRQRIVLIQGIGQVRDLICYYINR